MATLPKRRSSLASTLAIMVLPLAAIAATAGGLWYAGFLRLPAKGEDPNFVPEGMVRVLMSTRDIPPYTMVTRDHVWDAQGGRFSTILLPAASITSDMLISLNQIAGRVTKRHKRARYAFTEADFYPRGTRPGESGGIPPGMRGMTIDASKVSGMACLEMGDRFDLVATIAVDSKQLEQGLTGAARSQIALRNQLAGRAKQATVRVIVQNGVIVAPIHIRNVATSSASLIRGQVNQTRPVEEIVIAVAPEEVAVVTEALAIGADIACVPRSGRPEDDPKSRTPDHALDNLFEAPGGKGLSIVETINGDKREQLVVPSSGDDNGEKR